MSEQRSDKAGLHREISSIFKGVPIPQNDDGREPSGNTQSARTDHGEPQSAVTEPQKPDAPECQVTQSSPNVAEPEQPEAGVDDAKKDTSGAKGIPSWKTEDGEGLGDKAVQQSAGHGKPKPQRPEAPKISPATQSLPKSTGAQQPKARIGATKKDTPKRGTVVRISKISNDSILERIKNRLLTSKAGSGDARQKIMALVIPVLFVILLFFVHKGGVFGNKVREAQAKRIENLSSVDTADFSDGIDWEIPAPFPVTLRDPLQSDALENVQAGTEAVTEAGTPVRLIVRGILYSEDEASAVVNGRILHQGEIIQGATVIRINKDSVEFEMNGKRWTENVRHESGLGESQQEQASLD